MRQNFVTLGALWPRIGYTGLPQEGCEAFRQFLRMVPQHPDGDPDTQELFMAAIDTWGALGGERDLLSQLTCDFVPVPAYRGVVLANIQYDLKGGRVCDVLNTEVVWKWPYYQFSFTAFWGMLFHESNVALANPEYLFSKLLRLWECLHPQIIGRYELPGLNREKRWLWAALLERVLGAQFDALTEQPHYVDNICERVELSETQRGERIQLFTDAVQQLKERLLTGAKALVV